MSRLIRLATLQSRQTRATILANSPKRNYRVIGRGTTSDDGLLDRVVNFLSNVFGKGVKFFGWLINATLGTVWASFTGLWTLIVQTSSFIYNFNWNITSEEITQRFQQSKLILSGLAGGTIGNSLGFLACGVTPSAAILAVNESLGLYLLKEVGEEALDEFVANVSVLVAISFRLTAQNIFFNAYKNTRRAIKKYAAENKGDRKKLINTFYNGKIADAIEVWGEPNSKPWSFRLAIEERIESIQNPIVQEFVEEAYDEFLDACVEAGYVVANSLDNWVLQQRQAQLLQEQQSNLIEVLPDRDAPEERLIFTGNNQQVKSQIISSLNTFQMLDNRDVGQIIGEPLLDSVRKPPTSLTLRVILRSASKPPWKNADGSTAKIVAVTIPNAKKSKLDWLSIKNAFGGINGYLWGRFIVVARLNDGNMIKFFAHSETEGKKILNSLLLLTEAELTTVNITEEIKEGARLKYKSLYKESTRIYPANLTIINQNQVLRLNEGIATTRGIYKRRRYLIPLYTDNKPDNFDLITQEIFRKDD